MRQAALKPGCGDDDGDGDYSGPSLPSTLVVKSIRIHHRRTSVRLEPEMWGALYEIAALEGITIHDICAQVDDRRRPNATFSSALRVFLLRWYRNVAKGNLKARRQRILGKAS